MPSKKARTISAATRDANRPPPGYAPMLISLVPTAGKTLDDLKREMDKRGIPGGSATTFSRMRNDDSRVSLKVALRVRDILKDWGVDLSELPPIGVDGESPQAELVGDTPLARELDSIVSTIQRHESSATRARIEKAMEPMRALASTFKRIEVEIDKALYPTALNDDQDDD